MLHFDLINYRFSSALIQEYKKSCILDNVPDIHVFSDFPPIIQHNVTGRKEYILFFSATGLVP
jgi:hypothetical protein